MMISIAMDAPSVTSTLRPVVSKPWLRKICKNASRHSSVPVVGTYGTMPVLKGLFGPPRVNSRRCMAGCIGRITLPIEPLTKIGGFFRSKNLICPMRIPDGLRAIMYGDKTGSSIQNPTPLNKRLTQK